MSGQDFCSFGVQSAMHQPIHQWRCADLCQLVNYLLHKKLSRNRSFHLFHPDLKISPALRNCPSWHSLVLTRETSASFSCQDAKVLLTAKLWKSYINPLCGQIFWKTVWGWSGHGGLPCSQSDELILPNHVLHGLGWITLSASQTGPLHYHGIFLWLWCWHFAIL